MKNLNHNIDQIFNKESKKAEENTSFPAFEKVWDALEQKLNNEEAKKRTLFVWWPYMAAASVAIALGLVTFYNLSQNKSNSSITSNNQLKSTINQRVNDGLDSLKIAKLDQVIKNNIASRGSNSLDLVSNTPAPLKRKLSAKNSIEIQEVAQANISTMAINQPLATESADIKSAADEIENKKVVIEQKVIAEKAKMTNPSVIRQEMVSIAEPTDNADNNEVGEEFKEAKISLNKGVEPLYIVDGYVANPDFIKKYNVKKITSLSLIEGKNAIKLYGDYGKKGVVVITTKGLTDSEEKRLKEVSNNYNFSGISH